VTKFHNRVGINIFSPKGTKYVSPGQDRASVARQAAALGWIGRLSLGRVKNVAIIRHATEADTRPRLDFVLDLAPSSGDVHRSDDGVSVPLTQGVALGYHIVALSGQLLGTG